MINTVLVFVALILSLGCSRATLQGKHSIVPFKSIANGLAGEESNSVYDPHLITGILPNGLRYYVRSNAFPANRANLWLAVHAGSINEDDDQLGYAHFVEHMAFNGTKSFPGNSLIDFIEQSGMSFGSDLNAYTSFEETVYQLTIPTDDEALFKGGFQILDDWANGGILMDSFEVSAERGVVLGEWRARLPDTASRRFQMEALARVYGKESIFVRRFPIGDPELLKAATPDPLLRYYRDWYRPDLMAIIAVGDFDAKEVEKEILKRFGGLSSPPNVRNFEKPVIQPASQTIVHSKTERIWPHIELEWPAIPLSGDPADALRQELIDQISLPYLQRTFTALSKKDRRSFAGAWIRRLPGVTRRSHDRIVLYLSAAPDTLMQGFRIALAEIERVAQYGIPENVLEEEKKVLLRRYEAWADGSSSISSRSYAQKYTQHYLSDGGLLIGSEQQLELARRILPTITARDIAEGMRGWRNEAGRIASVMQPRYAPVPKIHDADVKELLNSVASASLDPASLANGLLGSPNTIVSSEKSTSVSITAEGSILSSKRFDELDVTVWNLSNGAKVVYKRSESHPDNITIKAHSLGGHSLLHDSLFQSPARLIGMLMTAAGGFGNATHETVQQEARATGLKEFHVGLNTFDEEILISGSPRELEYLFQIMYLQFTSPTVDSLALDDWRRNGFTHMDMPVNDRYALIHGGGHRRLRGPSATGVPFIDFDQALRVYKDRFGDASDFTFYIVGTVSADNIVPLVKRYVATLPSTNREVRELPRDFNIPLPRGKNMRYGLGFSLPPERAGLTVVYAGGVSKDTTDYLDASEELRVASWILGRRLRNELRERMAVTYSASSPSNQYWTPDPRYVVGINVTTDPEALDATIDAVFHEVAEFRNHGPSEEEIAIARVIRTRQLENARQSNKWWISRLELMDRLGISYSNLNRDNESVFSRERIKKAANRYFSENTYFFGAAKPPKLKKIDAVLADRENRKSEEENKDVSETSSGDR